MATVKTIILIGAMTVTASSPLRSRIMRFFRRILSFSRVSITAWPVLDGVAMETAPKTSETLPTLSATNNDFASHMHLVLSIVADFMRRVPRSVQREDLIAAGSMGLLHALRSKRHTCPEMLTAYARIRIRGAVIDELRRHDWSPRRRRTAAPASTPQPAIITTGSDPTNQLVAPANVAADKPGIVVIGFDDLPPTHSIREDGPSPLEQVESRRSSHDVRSAVAKLPPRERTIVQMRYFDEVPSKAIASTLGLSEARVSQLLARATSQLKQLLTEHDFDLVKVAA